MKKLLKLLVGIILLSFLIYYTLTKQAYIDTISTSSYGVLIVYEKGNANHTILNAYKSILDEEGVPYHLTDTTSLLTIDPKTILATKPAILFPDSVNQYIHADMSTWLKTYASIGGNVMLVGNVGVKTKQGHYRQQGSTLDNLLGIQINTYSKEKDNAYVAGNIKFLSLKEIDFFEIPRGKSDPTHTIVGYKYGQLDFPFANIDVLDNNNLTIAASSNVGTKIVPIIVQKKIQKGTILYVNLPLGYLKGHSDDMLPRSLLRTFLFKIGHLPHIVSTPNAKGGLVINFHIDSALELDSLPWMFTNGYFLKPLKYSMHITAGPSCDTLGDKHGFDADNKGKELVKKLMPYGIIGSHGGWAHNWFAEQIKNGTFSKEDIKNYIKKNNASLESITSYPIVEYAAPDGTFPQPMSVEVLKELGMTSFYYPGDSGSAPNRTFYDGKMVSKDIIAFPVMTFESVASLFELRKENYSGEKVFTLLKDIIDFVSTNRVTRLYYTHPYDVHLEGYDDEFKKILYYAIMLQARGQLTVETMSYFREFLLKVIHTKKTFTMQDKTLTVNLNSKSGFENMTLAIPKNYLHTKISLKGYDEDENYFYVPAESNTSLYHMDFHYE